MVKDLSLKKVLHQGHLTNHSLYKFPKESFQNNSTNSKVSCFSSNVTLLPTSYALLRHNRLGHLALPIVDEVLNAHFLPIIRSCDFYVSCQLTKSHRLSFIQSISHATKPFDLVHSNLWRPLLVNSVNEVKYLLVFIDDCTHFS